MIPFQLFLITFFSVVYIFASDIFSISFITDYEYGKLLYQNPRGISCTKCHGVNAKGKTISTFIHITKNKKKYRCTIKSPNITNIDFDTFKATLDPNIEKPKRKFNKNQVCEKLIYGNVMPTYFLTDEELNSIYFYLTNKQKYQE